MSCTLSVCAYLAETIFYCSVGTKLKNCCSNANKLQKVHKYSEKRETRNHKNQRIVFFAQTAWELLSVFERITEVVWCRLIRFSGISRLPFTFTSTAFHEVDINKLRSLIFLRLGPLLSVPCAYASRSSITFDQHIIAFSVTLS